MAIVNGKSGTFNISTKNPYISGYVKWQETYDNSTYLSTNITNVKMDMYLHRTNIYSGDTYIDDTRSDFTRIAHFGANAYTDKTFPTASERRIAGTTSSGGGAYTKVFSADWDIPHDTNGSKSVTIGFEMSNTSGNDTAGNSFTVPKTTATVTLTSIPRASTFKSVSGDTIGSSVTVTLDVKSSSYTHQLWYKVGNSGWYDLGKGIGSSKTFTIDSATANQFTSTSSGTMQLCVRTYNGTTQIGDDVYKDVTVYVPGYNVSSSGITLTGNNLLSGMYVKGKSTVTVKISASTSYGASIVSYSSTIDGKTYNGSSFTTSPLSNGTHKVTTVIKDSRGQTVTKESASITVYEYSSPSITTFTAVRNSTTPTTINVTIAGEVSSVNSKNTRSVTVTIGGQSKDISTSSYTFSGTTTFTGISTDNSYTAVATVTDSITSTSKSVMIPTAAVTLDFYNTGKGIAVGKVAEKDGLEIDWATDFNKAVKFSDYIKSECPVKFYTTRRGRFNLLVPSNADSSSSPSLYPSIGFGSSGSLDSDSANIYGYLFVTPSGELKIMAGVYTYTFLNDGNIGSYLTSAIADNRDVEYGTSGVWTYRKLDNGTAECWCTYTHETAVSKSWGSMYYADSLTPRINYPFTFTSRPIENVTFKGETSAGWLYTEGGGFSLNSTTQTGQYGICRPTSIGSSKLVFDYHVIGKWK